jgi:1-phosphatidylinositol-4-phosphate 5-kinase
MRHGIGTTIYRDGTIYRGEFRMNMKHGSGHITDKDRGVFTGNWEANVPLGKGTYKLICGDGVAGGPKEVCTHTRIPPGAAL